MAHLDESLDFTWIVQGELATISEPLAHPSREMNDTIDAHDDHLRLLWDRGVRSIYCPGNSPRCAPLSDAAGLHHRLGGIRTCFVPSIEQTFKAIDVITTMHKAVAVYDANARGPRDILLAAYLIAQGTPATDAMQKIRCRVASALADPEQEALVIELPTQFAVRTCMRSRRPVTDFRLCYRGLRPQQALQCTAVACEYLTGRDRTEWLAFAPPETRATGPLGLADLCKALMAFHLRYEIVCLAPYAEKFSGSGVSVVTPAEFCTRLRSHPALAIVPRVGGKESHTLAFAGVRSDEHLLGIDPATGMNASLDCGFWGALLLTGIDVAKCQRSIESAAQK